jgi:hypothetical protein
MLHRQPLRCYDSAPDAELSEIKSASIAPLYAAALSVTMIANYIWSVLT